MLNYYEEFVAAVNTKVFDVSIVDRILGGTILPMGFAHGCQRCQRELTLTSGVVFERVEYEPHNELAGRGEAELCRVCYGTYPGRLAEAMTSMCCPGWPRFYRSSCGTSWSRCSASRARVLEALRIYTEYHKTAR
jgi:hypothetical protein